MSKASFLTVSDPHEKKWKWKEHFSNVGSVFVPTLLEDLFCCQIEVLTGNSFINGHVDQDAGELPGIKLGLGIVSEMTVVFEVETQHRGVLPA